MGVTVFAEYEKYKLISDERDIAVAFNWRQAVWNWCQANGIDAEYQGTRPIFHVDLWRIKNEQHRAIFLLKWGNENRR